MSQAAGDPSTSCSLSTTADRWRDLCWAVRSPPLLCPVRDAELEGEKHQEPIRPPPESSRPDHPPAVIEWPTPVWFAAQAVPLPPSLPAPADVHHFRLGQYFEQLLLSWIRSRDDLDCIAHSMQVFDAGRTVGEFDFLVDNSGAHEHWEVAVKFYLGTGDTRRAEHWYGPNTSDRLDLKLHRLLDHQLLLSRLAPAAARLRSLGIDLQRVRCITKGRLYYPADAHPFDRQAPPPAAACAGHERGWWMSRSRFKAAFVHADARFVRLYKSSWLATLDADTLAAHGLIMDFNTLWTALRQPRTEQAVQVAILDDDGAERSRGFIVDRRWLCRTGQSERIDEDD